MKKILILAANSHSASRKRLDEEIREIDEGLRRSRHRKGFELKKRHDVRVQDFRRALLDEKPFIVHFCGHGSKEGILLEDNTLVDPQALSELFDILSEGLECVVLNACYSDEQAEAINRYIPYVIGIKGELDDPQAIEFAKGFYDGIGANKSIEKAFELGKNAIHLKNLDPDCILKLHVNPNPKVASDMKLLTNRPPGLIPSSSAAKDLVACSTALVELVESLKTFQETLASGNRFLKWFQSIHDEFYAIAGDIEALFMAENSKHKATISLCEQIKQQFIRCKASLNAFLIRNDLRSYERLLQTKTQTQTLNCLPTMSN